MKGLLRKDLYMLWSYCRSFLLLILIFSAASLGAENNSFFTVYPVMLGSILPVTLISYDERSGWLSCCHTLPVSRRMVVAEKYLVSLICSLCMLTLTGLVQFLSFSREEVFLWHRYFAMMSTMSVLAFVGPSLILPLIFKYGSEKGRIAYYFVIGTACALAFIVNDRQFPVIPLANTLLPLLSAAAMVVSFLLSLHFYQKREL